jgi:hypothetical protein
MPLSERAMEIARRQADGDMKLLAKLRSMGRVRRDDSPDTAFTRRVEAETASLRPGMDTIRPNKKKARKKR